ncbi:hypothetical protein GIX45_06765 [Erwinia sp. CPCC 100877]|nr:hypothetical protein [Erwinia sp. CPCC 100877]
MEVSRTLKIDDKIIFGRDKLWLIEMRQTENEFYVKVEFDIEEETIQRKLAFKNTVFCASIELDTFEKSTISSSWLESKSNFEEVENSKLLSEKYISIRSDYKAEDFKHYRISTYDNIIEIISEDYKVI